MEDALLIISGFILSAFLTGKFRWKAQDAGHTESVANNPARKIELPTGVGIVFSVITAGVAGAYMYFIKPEIATGFLFTVLAAGFIVSHAAYQLDLRQKNGNLISLIGLIIAIGGSVYALPQLYVSYEWLPIWGEKIIIAILWFGFVKSVEKHDTVDGLFPTVAIIIILGIGLLNIYIMPIALVLVGVLIAFLKLAINPAKAVMGNSGRAYIGFMVMAMALATASDFGTTYLIALVMVLTCVWVFSCHKTAPKAIAAGFTHKVVITHYIALMLASCGLTMWALNINFITPFMIAGIVMFKLYSMFINYIAGK
jgi:UDP-N-acetylmuramyl pentapeptide phosphotransferase/UDP-N-acetylglucosamine-1-phosphate transferase